MVEQERPCGAEKTRFAYRVTKARLQTHITLILVTDGRGKSNDHPIRGHEDPEVV